MIEARHPFVPAAGKPLAIGACRAVTVTAV